VNIAVVARALALVLGLCLSLAVAAAEPTAKKDKPAAKPKAAAVSMPTIIWRGDRATARAFVRELAKNFETTKQARIELQPFNTISGLDAVNDGSADMAGSARPPMPDRAEEKQLTFFPVAWDGLALITSPKNPVNDITLKQLYDIYLGRLTNWKELGGEDAPINLYAVASPLDGIEYSLRNLLYHHGDQAVSVPRLYVNVEKLEEGIALDPHALGVSTFSGVHANHGIKVLSVEGMSASPASVADGSYPLYMLLFVVSREDGKNYANVEKFVQYTNSDAAKAILRQHDLVPYADAPSLPGNEPVRTAFIDTHLGTAPAASAVASTGAPGGTPVSAPVATADFLIRTAPNAATTQEAKDRAARLEIEKKNGTKPDGAVAGH